MSERFVEANGLRFAYLEWGSPTDPLLLMFHGFPDTPHTWSVIAPRLAALGFRVVAPWMRGYAPTGIPKRDTTTVDLAHDVVELIGALGAKSAVIVGHDWGAEAVNAAAGLGPERIEKMVSVAIPHRTQLPRRASVAWAARHFFTLNLPGAVARLSADDFAMVDEFCKRWSPTWNFTAEELREVKRSFAEAGSAHAAVGYYRGASVFTPPFMKQKVKVPTLVIAGADDPAVRPSDFEKAGRHHSGPYQVAVIPGGHFCHRESPEPFVSAVSAFLKA
jgi:pimeloyl-ACP methyl ester carboxylesterase